VDGKTTSDASGRGARASDAGLIFADACLQLEEHLEHTAAGFWHYQMPTTLDTLSRQLRMP